MAMCVHSVTTISINGILSNIIRRKGLVISRKEAENDLFVFSEREGERERGGGERDPCKNRNKMMTH